jgi:IS5 family transposase
MRIRRRFGGSSAIWSARRVSSRRGREGMSGEQVLRVILVRQLGGFSYNELAFHLAGSTSYRAFCRIGITQKIPTAKTLQRNVKLVQLRTLEKINRLLVEHASAAGSEDGTKLRVDCTVVEANIHEPTDSSLLWDSVRVLTRLHCRAREYVAVAFTDHPRPQTARARHSACAYQRGSSAAVPGAGRGHGAGHGGCQRTIAASSTTYPPRRWRFLSSTRCWSSCATTASWHAAW